MTRDAMALLIVAICVSPIITLGICAFWRNLELSARDQDTRRYPRYGRPSEKRDKET